MTSRPSWGVLARVSAKELREHLKPIRRQMNLDALLVRGHAEWAAGFYMEPWPTSEEEGGELLRAQGLDVALLDFDEDVAGHSVSRWNGSEWAITGEDPIELCSAHGILVPGEKELRPPRGPHRPAHIRAISLVENANAEEVRTALAYREIQPLVEPGVRGTLVTEPDLGTYSDISARLPYVVYHLEYDPKDGRFVCHRLQDGRTMSAFARGQTWVRPNVPLVDDIEGETTPEGIVRKLGVPSSFIQT